MAVLGLLPPYTLADVKRAYHDRASRAHPDHGGSICQFRALQEAYEQAQQYLQFRSDKRSWIAGHMERYLEQQKIEELLRRFGARLGMHETDWLKKSYGDFADLTMYIEAIELSESDRGATLVDFIVERHRHLAGLKRLALVGCQLSDERVLRLSCFQVLEYLDLSRNPLTWRAARLAAIIPTLQALQLDNVRLGWWTRMKLARTLKRRRT
jgi:hypothetical protein